MDRQELQIYLQESWCTGPCNRRYLPTLEELFAGLVEQDPDGSLSLRSTGGGGGSSFEGSGLVPEAYTSVVQTLPSPSPEVEVYTFTLVGGGTAVVTVTYTDASKTTLVSAVRT